MFRENKAHLQSQIFNSLCGMDTRLKNKLETSWAGLFYVHVFSLIDEKLFAPLYCSDNGRPNFPVNVFVEPNITSDVEMAKKLLPDLVNKTGLKEMYTDGGYYGEDNVKLAEKLEIEIHFTDMTVLTQKQIFLHIVKVPYH